MKAPKRKTVFWNVFQILERGNKVSASKTERLTGPALIDKLNASPNAFFVVLTSRGRPYMIRGYGGGLTLLPSSRRKAVSA